MLRAFPRIRKRSQAALVPDIRRQWHLGAPLGYYTDFRALMSFIQASDEMATEKSSETCQVEQGRRAFPMLSLFFGIAVGVSVTLAITQKPAASHSGPTMLSLTLQRAIRNKFSPKQKSVHWLQRRIA